MTLRDLADEIGKPKPQAVIDRLLLDQPDRADEILDLLNGQPYLSNQVVAKVLTAEFGVKVGGEAVRRWRTR